MKILASAGTEEIAMVYIGETDTGNLVEFVESVQPPIPRVNKWVLLVSTLFGCPVGCAMCDAGGYYQGKPSKDEILAQIDFLVQKRYPDGHIPCDQFKIQFSRMGEPAYNDSVLEVLNALPLRYDAPGLMPSISTIAPVGRESFFEQLLDVHHHHYRGGRFQFQYSIHSTDLKQRDLLMPVKKWSFSTMADFGERLYSPGDRKITLNFALAQGMVVDPDVLLTYFNPEIFMIKITPLNPTYKARESGLASYIQPTLGEQSYPILFALRKAGYQVIVSIGPLEENLIGSNCGQYIKRHLNANDPIEKSYTYSLNNSTDI